MIGLGRFGTSLALELIRRGTDVLGIDHRPKVTQSLTGHTTHIATADSTDLGQILTRLGVQHVVFPEHDMGERVTHLVSGRLLDYMEVDDNFAIAKTRPPKDYVGIAIGRTNLRRKHGITIVAVKSPGQEFTYATADTELTYDDTIIVSGRTDQLERFAELP